MPTYESIGIAENISCDWVTTAGTFDSTFSDRSIYCIGVGYARTKARAVSQNVWYRCLVRTPTDRTSGSGDWIVARIYSSTDNILVDLILPTATIVGSLRYRNGGTLVTHPITTTLNAGTIYMLDFHVVTSATTGRVEVYLDDNLIYNITGINNGTDPVDRMEMYAGDRTVTNQPNRTAHYSEFLIGIGENSPTVGRRIFSRFPTANSAVNNTWTGGATQVNSGLRRTDADMSYTDAAGNRQGFTISAAPVLNSRIEAVAIYTQSFIGDGSARGMQHSVRIGGVNYDQPAVTVTRLPTYQETVMYTNPATSTSWSIGSFNGAEWGVIST